MTERPRSAAHTVDNASPQSSITASRVLESTTDRERGKLLVGCLALLPLLVVIGRELIPSHWTSIWGDSEFSGWVAPIANRLAHGPRLYAHGAHTPMAPLPFVLVHLLWGDHARWIDESALNFVCQGLAVMTLFAGFHRILPWPAPLMAAFGVLLSFTSLKKVILYDSLAQLFVAVTAVCAMHGMRAPAVERRARVLTTLSGVGAGLTLLSKQSTGTGTVLGVLLTIWLSQTSGRQRARMAAILRFGAGAFTGSSALAIQIATSMSNAGFGAGDRAAWRCCA